MRRGLVRRLIGGAGVIVVTMAGATVAAPPAPAGTPVPGQFIAKMYTEALGRLPDPGGWSAYVENFSRTGCTAASIRASVRAFYLSAEFAGLGYDNQERMLALYRGALNREPDQGGFDHYVDLLGRGAMNWRGAVEAFAASDELGRLVPAICGTSTSYHFGTTPAPTLRPTGDGFGNGTGEQLQALLDAARPGDTVYLAQKAVVRLTRPLVIPEGRTLATVGAPGPERYARQGRLVRLVGGVEPFDDAMVQLRSGAKLRNVWVDGQRGAYTNYLLKAVNVQLMGGDGTALTGSKISNSLGWTNVQVFGTYEQLPCAGATVSGNIVTAYSSHHYRHGDVGPWTDGLSVACERAVVESNGIVDATDVGIVLFRAHPAVQKSVVRNNQVLNAGNSAYGALGVDGLHSQGIRPDFTGGQVSGNAFWTAPDTHVDFGIVVGTRPWFGTLSDTGTGITVADNHTHGLPAVVGTGIAVSGMYRATVRGNDLSAVSVQPIGGCPHVAIGIDAEGYAGGSDVQPGGSLVRFTNPAGGGCVGH